MQLIAFILIVVLILAVSIAPIVPMRRRQGAGRVPVVTLAILLINILLFFAYVKDGNLPDSASMTFGLIPRHANLLALLTHMFFHGSFLQFAGKYAGSVVLRAACRGGTGTARVSFLVSGRGLCGWPDAGFLHQHVYARHRTFADDRGIGGIVRHTRAIRASVLADKGARLHRLPDSRYCGCGRIRSARADLRCAGVRNRGCRRGGRELGACRRFFVWGGNAGLLRLRDDGKREYELEDAEKAVKKGDLDSGAAHYRAALEEKSDDADAQLALARVCVQQRQSEAAHRHYAESIRLFLKSNTPAAAKTYEEAVGRFTVFPLPPDMLQRVASACETTLHFPLAQRALSELCREYPDAKESELGLLRLGKLHMQKMNQPQNAVAIFQEFLRLYPASEWQNHVEQLLSEAQIRVAA